MHVTLLPHSVRNVLSPQTVEELSIVTVNSLCINDVYDPLHWWGSMNNRINQCRIAQEDCWVVPLLRRSVNDILVHLMHVA